MTQVILLSQLLGPLHLQELGHLWPNGQQKTLSLAWLTLTVRVEWKARARILSHWTPRLILVLPEESFPQLSQAVCVLECLTRSSQQPCDVGWGKMVTFV